MKLYFLILLVPCLAADQNYGAIVSNLMDKCLTIDEVDQVRTTLNSPKLSAGSGWPTLIDYFYDEPKLGVHFVLKFGLCMPFGSDKISYYSSMIKFFQQKQGDKTSEQIKALIGANWDPKLDVLVDSQPAVAVLKFENEIINNIKASLVNVLLGKQRLTDSDFYKVDWSWIAHAQLERQKDNVLPLQATFDAAASDHFFQIRIDDLVDQIESIAVDSDSIRIKKILLYGALIHACNEALLHRQIVLHYFKVVISWKEFAKTSLPVVFSSYFQQYRNDVEQSLHGCAKTVLNAPAEKEFAIKSENNYEELMYCQAPTYPAGKSQWNKMPKIFQKETYMPAHLWIPCSSKAIWKAWYKWVIRHEGDRFFIETRNPEAPGRILDASFHYVTHCAQTTNMKDAKFAFRLIPSNRDNRSCYIQHYQSARVIFAVATRYTEDADRRQVSAEGNFESIGNLWNFIDNMQFE